MSQIATTNNQMYYCEYCRKENGWPVSAIKRMGICDECKARVNRYCNVMDKRDLSAYMIDKPAPHKPAGVREISLGEELFEFTSHIQWVNKAKSWFQTCGVQSRDTICIDAAGRICVMGRDFMTARDQNKFPIKVYKIRSDL